MIKTLIISILHIGGGMVECTDDIGFLLCKASRLSKHKVNQKLSEVGLTFPQFLVIRHLYDDGGPRGELTSRSPAAVAAHLGYDRPTMTGIIDRLVKQGFAVRESNPADRRSHTIVLTEKSKKLICIIDSLILEANDKMLSSFQEEEKEKFKLCLIQIIKNLDY